MEHETGLDPMAYRFIGPGNFDGSRDASANTPGISIGSGLSGGSSGGGPAVGPASPLVALVGLAGVLLMIMAGLTSNLALFPVGLLLMVLALPISLWERRRKAGGPRPRPQAQPEPAPTAPTPPPARQTITMAERRRDAGLARLQRKHPGLKAMTIHEIWEMLDYWSSTSRGAYRLRVESLASKRDVTITKHKSAGTTTAVPAPAAAPPDPWPAAATSASSPAASLPAERVPIGAAAARAASVMSQARTNLGRATDEGTSDAAQVGFDTPAARDYPPAPVPADAPGAEPWREPPLASSSANPRPAPEVPGGPRPGARLEDTESRPTRARQEAGVVLAPAPAQNTRASRPEVPTPVATENYVLELYDDTIEGARLDARQPELADASIVEQILVGAIEGDAVEDPTKWAIAGQVVSGFIPIWGQIADGRDILIGIGAVWNSGMKDGKAQLGLSLIALAPGLGDYLKACVKPVAGNAVELAKIAHVAEKEATLAKQAKKVTVEAAAQEPKVVQAVEKGLDAFFESLRRDVVRSGKIADARVMGEFEALLVKFRKASADQLKPTAMVPFAKGYRWEVARFMQVLRDPEVTRITAIGRKAAVEVREKSGKIAMAELEIDLEFVRGGFHTMEELKNTRKLGDERLMAQLDKIKAYVDQMKARGVTVDAVVRGTFPDKIVKRFKAKAKSFQIRIQDSR